MPEDPNADRRKAKDLTDADLDQAQGGAKLTQPQGTRDTAADDLWKWRKNIEPGQDSESHALQQNEDPENRHRVKVKF